jgi:hypothetical protein
MAGSGGAGDRRAGGGAPESAGSEGTGEGREVAARAVKCTQCGAPFTLRGFARTLSAACEYCGALYDTSKHEWQLIEKVQRRREEAPLWPLGTKARFEGRRFDLVGWMKRYVTVDHERYYWEEHLFFSPFHGYRYLVYSDGHFTLVKTLPGVPWREWGGRVAHYERESYRHFQTARALVSDVVGEFPWRVKRESWVTASDYVAPPLVLSEEKDDDESVWSRGVYMSRAEVVSAVGEPPRRSIDRPRTVAANQPNPYRGASWLAGATAVALLVWCFLTFVYFARSANELVLDVEVPPKAVAAVGSEDVNLHVYPLKKLDTSRSTATVQVLVSAYVDNNWAFASCALVDTKEEKAYPFGAEVSYYHGYEDGESWSEGSRDTEVLLGGIPNGEYVLQVERDDSFGGSMRIMVRRDVALYRYPLAALLIICVFPVIFLVRSRSFEARRWAESDHAPE